MSDYSGSESGIERELSVVQTVFCLIALFVGAMTAVRLLFEALFPTVLAPGNPVVAVGSAVLIVLIAVFLGGRLLKLPATLALTPLLLNLVYLFDPAFDVVNGRFLFFASIWLSALFLAHQQQWLQRNRWLPLLFIVAILLPVYLLTMGRTVGTADTFEFQVVIPKLGIVHPTGYPLYLLLTKFFTFIPLGTTAWRINLGTAVYGIGAACLLYLTLKNLMRERLVAVLTAVLFGLTPTFWSQSIQAEVYSLHALIVAGVVWGLEIGGQGSGIRNRGLMVAFLLGLGLTNHLTTLVLLVAVVIFVLVRHGREWVETPGVFGKRLLMVTGAFLLPLLLYLYLPLRWQAVNGEAMGAGRFVDWVVGGRFQGALQLMAWLRDPARYEVVGRLFTAEWAWLHLLIAVVGLLVLARRNWRAAMFLALGWLGFSFYALSYYVPDLSVFLIPAHLFVALAWGVAVAAFVNWLKGQKVWGGWIIYPLLTLLMVFIFQQAAGTWKVVDASARDGETAWGRAVLAQDLDPEGAILADSLKFPPLYYLQQAEGLRPNMDIMVLPDEAAYRAELDGRLANGQTVYLARFLPGVAGVYHLRSVGPLTEASTQPLIEVPESADVPATDIAFGSINLAAYDLQMISPYQNLAETSESAVTFYWQSAVPVEPVWQVYLRWAGEGYEGPTASQFPANNSYPTNAFRAGEVVVDFHTLPRPVLNETTELALQVALAPAFTPSDELDWQRVTTAVWEPAESLSESTPLQAQVGPLLLDGISMPEQVRPQSDLRVQVHGYGANPKFLTLILVSTDFTRSILPKNSPDTTIENTPFAWSYDVSTDLPAGRYLLEASFPGQGAVCSWLARESAGCILGEIEVSGVPLPEDAVNFEDKIALLAVDVPDTALHPGGELAVDVSWLGLANMSKDYTVFVQVLDAEDNILVQVDSWPLQGTFPTSQWAVGERVEDPYLIRIPKEVPPGQYRLQVGFYLLETFQRLSVYDGGGTAVDDKLVVPLETVE